MTSSSVAATWCVRVRSTMSGGVFGWKVILSDSFSSTVAGSLRRLPAPCFTLLASSRPLDGSISVAEKRKI